MTDLHCHILPGIDDGAQDHGESSRMLELAAEGGTRAIVATPHADLRYEFEPGRCRELLQQLQEQNPNAPRLYLGCEVHLTPENISAILQFPATYAINARDCVLLELPERIMPPMVDPAIGALVDSGLRVVIAHPERNPYIQQYSSYADRLVEEGCYLQLTARSLQGGFGSAASSTASYILKRRLGHFIATDAHGATVRRPGLSTTFDLVAKLHGESSARTLLVDNPEAAINGTAIAQMPASPSWIASIFSKTTHGLRKTVPQMP